MEGLGLGRWVFFNFKVWNIDIADRKDHAPSVRIIHFIVEILVVFQRLADLLRILVVDDKIRKYYVERVLFGLNNN